MDKSKILAIVVVILFLGLLGSCFGGKSEYEEAGETFGQWGNKDPNTWSDTQKEYLNDAFDHWNSN